MLTLAEAARRDALEIASPDLLVRWRTDIKAKCIALIEAEFAKTPFADIKDIDTKAIESHLDDGLSDATYQLMWEME